METGIAYMAAGENEHITKTIVFGGVCVVFRKMCFVCRYRDLIRETWRECIKSGKIQQVSMILGCVVGISR